MKKIINGVLEKGGQTDVRMAMFIFLKFISSVIPAI